MPETKPAPEPTTAEVLDDWRVAERSAIAAQRAADAAERASEAAERAALAAERVAEAAMMTLAVAQESLDLIRASVAEARVAATTSSAESVDLSEQAHVAKAAEAVSRERYQQRTGAPAAENDANDREAAPVDKRDMGAVGDDGQVFGG